MKKIIYIFIAIILGVIAGCLESNLRKDKNKSFVYVHDMGYIPVDSFLKINQYISYSEKRKCLCTHDVLQKEDSGVPPCISEDYNTKEYNDYIDSLTEAGYYVLIRGADRNYDTIVDNIRYKYIIDK